MVQQQMVQPVFYPRHPTATGTGTPITHMQHTPILVTCTIDTPWYKGTIMCNHYVKPVGSFSSLGSQNFLFWEAARCPHFQENNTLKVEG